MNVSIDANELASIQLAKRLQEEEDCNAALLLQSQLANGIVQSPARYVIPDDDSTNQIMNIIDSDSDDDELFIIDTRPIRNLTLSDDDNTNVHPISPDTQMIVTDALNTAFSSPRTPITDHDVMIVNDIDTIEDNRPINEQRRNSQPAQSSRGTRSSARLSRNTVPQDHANVVLTVGRMRNSQPVDTGQTTSSTGSSLVITNTTARNNNNPLPHTYNTRSSSQTHSTNPGPSSTRSSLDVEILDTIQNNSNEPSSSGINASNRNSNPRNRQRNRNNRNTRGNRGYHRSNQTAGNSSINGDRNHGLQTLNSFRNNALFGRQVIVNGIPIHAGNGTDMFNTMGTVINFPHFGHPSSLLLNRVNNDYMDESMTYEQMIALDDENNLEPGHGLDKGSIDRNTISQSFSQNISSKNCNICLNDFVNGEKVRTLPCFHSFHTKCIDNWLSRKPECPVCRHAVGRS